MSISYPLSAPEVREGDITIDLMLKEPTRITRYVSDLSTQGFFIDQVFSTSGVSGGALLYDQLLVNDLYAIGDPGIVSPGGEFPMVEHPDREPKVAKVQKIGGKFAVTDEAVKRNNPVMFQQGATRLANSIRREVHKLGLKALEDSLGAIGDKAITLTSAGWAAPTKTAKNAQTPAGAPVKDFIDLRLAAEQTDLGISYDTLILNPADYANFQLFYGTEAGAILSSFGLRVFSTPLVAAGEGYAVAAGQVGVMGLESPLSTETWREERIQSVWTQSWVTPAFAVTNPLSIVKISGLSS